jgi:hypothetical protein
MTIAQIEGGLGSQMFGYAAARRLALRYDTEVLLDLRNYRTYMKFQPELQHFDVDATALTYEQADELCGVHNEKIQVVRNAHLHVDRSILQLPTPWVLMIGNYVSEDYFFDVIPTIRKDFVRLTEPDDYAKSTSDTLQGIREKGYSLVAVHVRHGDYVSEADVNYVHGVTTSEYYANAMQLMEQLVNNPWFVFFSDDTPWIEANFRITNRTVTQPPPGTAPIEDMMLMASCDHHIIANSGYSWWGAWLSKNETQRVICPRPIIADRTKNTEDMPLRNWISLGSTIRPS